MEQQLRYFLEKFDVNLGKNDEETESKISFGVIPELVARDNLFALEYLHKHGYTSNIVREYLLVGRSVPTEFLSIEEAHQYDTKLREISKNVSITSYYLGSHTTEELQACELVGKINAQTYIEFALCTVDGRKEHFYYARKRGALFPKSKRSYLDKVGESKCDILFNIYPDEITPYVPIILTRAVAEMNDLLIEKCLKMRPDYKDIVEKAKQEVFMRRVLHLCEKS